MLAARKISLPAQGAIGDVGNVTPQTTTPKPSPPARRPRSPTTLMPPLTLSVAKGSQSPSSTSPSPISSISRKNSAPERTRTASGDGCWSSAASSPKNSASACDEGIDTVKSAPDLLSLASASTTFLSPSSSPLPSSLLLATSKKKQPARTSLSKIDSSGGGGSSTRQGGLLSNLANCMTNSPDMVDQNFLTCSICRQRYKEPKVLPCLHTFCLSCLTKSTPEHSLTLTCPVCRLQSILPPEGVSGLQTNIYMTSLLEVVEEEGEIYPCELHYHRRHRRLPLLNIRLTSKNDQIESCVDDVDSFGRDESSTEENQEYHEPERRNRHHHHVRQNHHRLTNGVLRINGDEGSDEVGVEDDEEDRFSSMASECSSSSDSSSGSSGTPSTFKCVDCRRYICDDCAQLHSEEEHHRVVPLSECQASEESTEQYLFCPSHAGQRLRFYCKDCETAICISCTDIEHRHHNTARLHHAVMEHRVALRQLLDRVLSKVPLLESALEGVSETLSQLHLSRDEAEHSITLAFAGLQAALESRREQLLEALDSTCKAKAEVLSEQSDELADHLSEIRSSCEFVSRALSIGTDTEVLMVRKQLGDRLEALSMTSALTNSAATSSVSLPTSSACLSISPSPSPSPSGAGSLDTKLSPSVVDLFPRGNSHIAFHPAEVEAVRGRLLKVGAISDCSAVPWRSSCHPQGKNRRSDPEWRCLVGRPCRVLVRLKDFRGEPALVSGAQDVLKAELQSTHPMIGRPPTQIDPMRPGELEVSFSLPQEGEYFLTLTLFDHHINGSPVKVIAIREDDSSSGDRPASKLARTSTTRISISSSVPGGLCGSAGGSPGSVGGPSRSRRTSRSSVGSIMSMSGSKRLVPALPDDLLGKFGRKGRCLGEFANPQGTCCLPDGNIVVSDSNNQCVQTFTEKGDCILRFGVRGRGVGQLQRPTGVAALPNNNIVVADYENRCLSIFDPTGKFVTRMGVNKLLGPKGVTTDTDGRIIAVDNKGSCVVVFAGETGKIVSRFGTRGLQASQLAGPHYAALTRRGLLVVSDFHNHCIKVFDKNGKYAFGFGSNGEGNGQFNAPTGVAVDSLDNIIVADWGNSRLQVFDYQGMFMGYINSHSDPLYGPQDLSLTTSGIVIAVDSGNHCVKLLDNKYGL